MERELADNEKRRRQFEAERRQNDENERARRKSAALELIEPLKELLSERSFEKADQLTATILRICSGKFPAEIAFVDQNVLNVLDQLWSDSSLRANICRQVHDCARSCRISLCRSLPGRLPRQPPRRISMGLSL
jgi:hypothetical protein